MWKPVQVLALGLIVVTAPTPAVSGKRLLAIFAHPDDEGIVGPLLARYARERAEVHLALVTSGQKGKRPWVQTPAGEALGREREEEAACACRAYGIHPPILLRFQDGEVTGPHLARLASAVRRLFRELRPEVVITWGPECLYGHPDHRLVGAVVTEVFQSNAAGSARPKALFYPGIPARRLEQTPAPSQMSIHPVQEEFLPVRIPYTAEDFARARKAHECHKTQFSPEEMQQLMSFQQRLESGVSYLRPWFSPGQVKNNVFE